MKLFKPDQFIVSVVTQNIRSTGDIFQSGVSQTPYHQIDTYFADTAEFNAITQSVVSNPTMTSFIGAMSLDGLYVPYSTYAGHTGLLPHFETPTNSGEVGDVISLHPFNPSNIFGVGVKNTGIVDSGSFNASVWGSGGHNITAAMTVDESATNGSMDSGIYPVSNAFDADFHFRKKTELNDIRGVAHRAPMVLSGWGYDTDGNPVPTGADGGLHPEALHNTSLWKTGPLDVRWDNNRKVWSAGDTSKTYLVKVTNTYNPPNFSYEVERSLSRDQFTRSGPATARTFSSSDPIYDPEYLAYTANPDNAGTYEQLNYTGLEFPHYEAFIIRETVDEIGQTYYNIWSEDCQDCGPMSNQCPSGQGTRHGSSSLGKKILIENPLRQALDVGDLAFTVATGRSKNVNTNSFVGGSGVGASGNISVNAGGTGVFNVTAAGSGYTLGGFGLISSGICLNLTLAFNAGAPYGLASGTILPSTNLPPNKTYSVSIYPANSTATTESLPIHWIMQAEFKSQQVVTHIECDHGMLQTCSVKIQTQGQKSCEWCGEDSALVSSY